MLVFAGVPSSCSQTNAGTVSKAAFERGGGRGGGDLETGWSAYGLSRAHRYHLERNEAGVPQET